MNPPRLSHSHSLIGHGPPLGTAETSLHKPLRLPSAFTVDHDLEGAIFRRWLHLDRPLQGGRQPAVGVKPGRIPRGDGAFDPAVFPVRRWVRRSSLGTSGVGPVAPHHFGPLLSPILPGDDHRLDPAELLARHRPEDAVRRSPRTQALVGRVPRIDSDDDGPVGLDGNRRLEREVASSLPHSFPAHALGKPL